MELNETRAGTLRLKLGLKLNLVVFSRDIN